MAKTIGVILSDRILTGLVLDHKLHGQPLAFPEDDGNENGLVELHTDLLVETVCHQVTKACKDSVDGIAAIGVALPGLIRNNVVEESPNLPQLKGARVGELLEGKLRSCGINAPVTILNDADGAAAGLAAQTGKLDSIIRIWTLGVGIGFGRYPFLPGWWEAGHSVVTLDDKERFCGCGGRGHMEGIMGHRAMRLRFLDMEPEEVFELANKTTKNGSPVDPRCLDFKKLWHKALAAATATSIHQDGAGKFFLTGFNARFVDLNMLRDYLAQMVKMSPLQGYSMEIVDDDPVTRMVGAAIMAEQAAGIK